MEESAAPKGVAKKRQFLIQMDADLIRRIKILAIERDVTASSLVQKAVADFLACNAPTPPSADHGDGVPCP